MALIKDLIKKMDQSKRSDGSYNHEILSHMREIENFIRSLETMTLDEFCLLRQGIEPDNKKI